MALHHGNGALAPIIQYINSSFFHRFLKSYSKKPSMWCMPIARYLGFAVSHCVFKKKNYTSIVFLRNWVWLDTQHKGANTLAIWTNCTKDLIWGRKYMRRQISRDLKIEVFAFWFWFFWRIFLCLRTEQRGHWQYIARSQEVGIKI